MEHDPEGHERLQVPKCRRDVEPEIEPNWVLVAGENEVDPLLQERQEEVLAEAPVESASVKHGSSAVSDNEERACGQKRPETRYTRRAGTPGQGEGQARAEERSEARKHTTSPRPGGRGNVDSSCYEWLCSISKWLELEC